MKQIKKIGILHATIIFVFLQLISMIIASLWTALISQGIKIALSTFVSMLQFSAYNLVLIPILCLFYNFAASKGWGIKIEIE